MKVILVAGAVALLTFSGCSGNDRDRDRERDRDRSESSDRGERSERDLKDSRQDDPPSVNNAATSPSTATSHPAHFVGRWTPRPDCVRPMELRADGSMTTAEGSIGTWSYTEDPDGDVLTNDPSTITLNAEGQSMRSAVTSINPLGERNEYELRPENGPPFRIRRC